MNGAHFSEIEKVLLYISEARERAERARLSLIKGAAEAHLVGALKEIERTARRAPTADAGHLLRGARPGEARRLSLTGEEIRALLTALAACA